jgi:Tfp pilus assembly protein PilX
MKKMFVCKDAGYALVIVVLVILVTSVLGGAMLTMGAQNRVYSVRTAQEIAARCAADAALTKAIYQMNQKLTVDEASLGMWNPDPADLPSATDQVLPNCDASYSYKITPESGDFTIEAIGKSGQAWKTVYANVGLHGPFEYAICGTDALKLYSNTVITGYNYEPGEILKIGTISKNSDAIDLKSGTTINGDVVVGVGGDPATVIKDLGATITGTTCAMYEEPCLPPVTVPAQISALSYQPDIKKSTTITTSGKYRKIDLGNGEIVMIDGPVTLYVTEKIILDNGAQLQINGANPNASLTLYLGCDFEGKNGGSINNMTADAEKLKIYGLPGCRSLKFKNSTEFYGALYAPDAEVEFNNSADAYGSVVAKKFEQKNSAGFHYDASLGNVTVNDEGLRFAINRWSE